MANFDEQFVRAVANGDEKAVDMVRGLSAAEKINLGIVVDEMRTKEGIVPMQSGLNIYASKEPTKYSDDAAVAKALHDRLRLEKENAERQERIRKEELEKRVKYEMGRARSGLTK